MFKLRTDNRFLVLRICFRCHFFRAIIPEVHLGTFFFRIRNHCQCLSRADICTATAFEAVELVNYDRKAVFLTGFSFRRRNETCRSFCTFFFRRQNGANRSMRADEGTLYATDTFFSIPGRNIQCRTCFFELGRTYRHRTVFAADEVRYLQIVADLTENRSCHVFEVFRCRTAFYFFVHSVSPRCGIIYFMEFTDTCINSSPVHINNLLTLLAVRLDNRVLQVFNSVIQGDNFCKCEESSLHYHVDTCAEAEFLTDSITVQGVEFYMVFSNRTFDARRQLMIQFFIRPGTVKHKRTAVFNAAKQIKTFYIRLAVTSNIVSCINQVRHIDRFRTETQVRYRYAAGFLGIICKVCLCVQIRMVTDNLDSRFIGTDCTVGTEAPEFASRKTGRIQRHFVGTRQGKIRNVINDTDSETVHRMIFLEFFEYGENIFRKNVLRAETCTTADNVYIKAYRLSEVYDIKVQGFTHSTRFFCTIDNGNLLNRLRQYGL